MKIVSTHFVLKDGSDYKDLAPVFPDLLKALLEEIGQMPEEDEILQMYIALNMADLELNRKPEGYNRKGKVRLVSRPMRSLTTSTRSSPGTPRSSTMAGSSTRSLPTTTTWPSADRALA